MDEKGRPNKDKAPPGRKGDMGKPGSPTPHKEGKEKKKGPKKERWLLTRKTWRYMADAGRKLIPDGHNKPEDLPKIESYFQEVCTKETKFLLWRKQSYPGALKGGRSRGGRKKGGSCRYKATSSADEAEDAPTPSPTRFDLHKMKQEFLFGKESPQQESTPSDDETGLIGTLEKYLYEKAQPAAPFDHQKLIDKLREHLATIELEERRPRPVHFMGDHVEKALLETLRRYYSKSTKRDKVISDLLTDRKHLERLYNDLRKARGYVRRGGGAPGYTSATSFLTAGGSRSGGGALPTARWTGRDWKIHHEGGSGSFTSLTPNGEESPARSPALVIHVEPDPPITTWATQTDIIPPRSWAQIEEEVKKWRAAKEGEHEKEGKCSGSSAGLVRRSSVDNDDVSPSVSDTIKRYLRMARKKSVDSDKADRFRRVNYDRNLRNIKPKGEITSISDDDGCDKGCQTDETWVEALKDVKIETIEFDPTVTSSRSSLTEEPVSPTSLSTKSFLSSGQSFLSHLLHGLHDCTVSAGGMQKSKSSTSVVQEGSRLGSRKIWKSRSKSQTRATPSASSAWTPQGRCVWSNVAGRIVTLTETTLPQLSGIERRVLQKVALAKLQALSLGINIRIPSESSASAPVTKPKRKAYLLKRKAITTGFFDTSRKEEKDKDENTGMVFGIPLSQCIENERARLGSTRSESETEDVPDLTRKPHHGSRGSFSSLIETPRSRRGSSESLICSTLSMPGLDRLSCGSVGNLLTVSGGSEGVPNIVTSCLRHLETHGLHTLGIFRVSSSKKRVRQLREEFDCGKEIYLDDDLCPHDVATLLKEYFRDLPDSLLCKDLYLAFIQTQRIRNRKLQHEALQHLLQLLPVANQDTLWSLLNLLALVAEHSNGHKDKSGEWIAGNKMDSSNLATLFAPNILHIGSKTTGKDEMSPERVEERSDAINVIRTLIDNHTSLFQVSAELLNDVYIHMMDSHPDVLDQIMRRKDTSGEELEDNVIGLGEEADKKYWSREACTHEAAAMGGPDMSMRPRTRLERSRERLSQKRREEAIRKKTESESSSRRTSGSLAEEKSRFSSSDSGHLSPDDSHKNDGVLTASLKIPVPQATSFSLNLDDIPFIEDGGQQITLGIVKSGSQVVTSESGVGSFSPPTRPPSVTSWGSTPTSPECEPTTASISFPTKQQAVLQRVTIKNTGQVQLVQPSYVRAEVHHSTERHHGGMASPSSSSSFERHLTRERISKSLSTSSVLPVSEHSVERTKVNPSITSIGGAVFRSKTADIERILRLQRKQTPSQVALEKDYKRKHTDTRLLARHLHEERTVESASRTDSRSLWKRRELISSDPKERRNFY